MKAAAGQDGRGDTAELRRRVIGGLALATAVAAANMQMFLPALPELQAAFAVSAATVQLAVSLPLMCFAAGLLVWGLVGDRLGRRGALLGGMALLGAGNIAAALAEDFSVLVAGRMMAAAGGAAALILARALVSDGEAPHRVPQALAVLSAAHVALPMMAPLAGGLLVEGWHWQGVFWAMAAAACLGAAAVAGTVPRDAAAHLRAASAVAGWACLLAHRRFMALAVFLAAGGAAYFAFLAGAPALAIGVLGLSPAAYGSLLPMVGVAFLSGILLGARLSRRWDGGRVVLTGAVIVAAGAVGGLALSAFSGTWVSPAALFGPMLVMALGSGTAVNAAHAVIMALVPGMATSAAGLAAFAQIVAGAAAAQSVGLLHDGTPQPLMAVLALCATVALLAAIRARRGSGSA